MAQRLTDRFLDIANLEEEAKGYLLASKEDFLRRQVYLLEAHRKQDAVKKLRNSTASWTKEAANGRNFFSAKD